MNCLLLSRIATFYNPLYAVNLSSWPRSTSIWKCRFYRNHFLCSVVVSTVAINCKIWSQIIFKDYNRWILLHPLHTGTEVIRQWVGFMTNSFKFDAESTELWCKSMYMYESYDVVKADKSLYRLGSVLHRYESTEFVEIIFLAAWL